MKNIPIKERGTGKLIVNLILGLSAAGSYLSAINIKKHLNQSEIGQLIMDAFNAGQKYEQNR